MGVEEKDMPGQVKLRSEKELGDTRREAVGAQQWQGLVLMVGREYDTVDKGTYEGRQGWAEELGRRRRG